MSAANQAAISQIIADTYRLLVLVNQVIANPTQANIDAAVAAGATGNQTLKLKPNYSEQGVSVQWNEFRTQLIASLKELYVLQQFEEGPFEVRSRGRA